MTYLSKPDAPGLTHIISLGAGVQSSTMALMAAAGEILPMPVAAIFADTGDEPASVYRWLDWLEKQLPFPVHRTKRVYKGKHETLRHQALEMRTTLDGRKFSKTSIPLFTLNNDGSRGMVTHRDCTVDFKINPIRKLARSLAGIKRGQKHVSVHQWIGISLDEMHRMKPSRDLWCMNRWPLIEKRITRHNCLVWMEDRGYPTPPRSACVFCPFHGDVEWRRLKRDEPDEFAKAVQFEKDLQDIKAASGNFKTTPFLHASRLPLDQVDFRSDGDLGQRLLWDDECEGMCGV